MGKFYQYHRHKSKIYIIGRKIIHVPFSTVSLSICTPNSSFHVYLSIYGSSGLTHAGKTTDWLSPTFPSN